MTVEPTIAGSRVVRIGVVEDHATTCRGLQALLAEEPDLQYTAAAPTVPELLAHDLELDLVVLDLLLTDGSSPAHNVERLNTSGLGVLVFTSGDSPRLIRQAARAGVLGVVRKSEPEATLLDALRQAGAGQMVPTADWAAAVDGDPEIPNAGLSPRELEVLRYYASGEKLQRVAHRINTAPSTVREHVNRIRAKYARVGRPAITRVDLYRRAVEDDILPPPGGRVA